MNHHILKKPKVEEEDNGTTKEKEEEEYTEQEEALVALIEHRTKEFEHCKKKVDYYKSQLEEAEKRLNDSQSKLARLRKKDSNGPSKSLSDCRKNVKEEAKASSPVKFIESNPRATPSQSRPQLVIPAVNPKIAQPVKLPESSVKASVGSGNRAIASFSTNSNGVTKIKGESSYRPSDDLEVVEVQDKGTKRKFVCNLLVPSKSPALLKNLNNAEEKEHKELISLIRSSSSPRTIRCQNGVLISSQHKRKLRSLALCPTNDQLFVTRSGASLLSSTECMSTKQRRWPEDITWHPHGDKLFSVYTADGGDSQISIMNLNTTKKGKRVTYLEESPHVKGIINNIVFMPWEDLCFVTGGSDHAVVFWNEKNGGSSWKCKALHRNLHSSAVMGVAGLQQKNIVLSAGADKRIVGFDVMAGRADFKHQIECKCMSVLPNPSDFNLFMVQTGAHERQLRLFDIRLRQTEIHSFGWKQESSESQSALINQAWSPDGLYITSGSADPMIHVFDIRYNSHRPSQSVKAHNKRVFKAVWLQSLPLLVSISSDLNVGLHKIA
ncbi:hypothetical protein IFM89_016377 [Coptis chinensis]|uniref:Uncharacterized protein n=1 Tax=Coptis chinensis TaxID=261450 RepID=A0A835LRV9_9MAGN|nr:hypothetical protein IFM89_016377 [Coptis chinensis]